MRRVYIIAMCILATSSLSSCKGNKDQNNHDAAGQLFMKSMYLTEEYIDSIRNASDSAAVNRIFENFNLKLTTVNYQFPPDTDLELSEEENDSLIRMFTRLDAIIDKKLKSFAGISDNDSIPADSINLRKDSVASFGKQPPAT